MQPHQHQSKIGIPTHKQDPGPGQSPDERRRAARCQAVHHVAADGDGQHRQRPLEDEQQHQGRHLERADAPEQAQGAPDGAGALDWAGRWVHQVFRIPPYSPWAGSKAEYNSLCLVAGSFPGACCTRKSPFLPSPPNASAKGDNESVNPFVSNPVSRDTALQRGPLQPPLLQKSPATSGSTSLPSARFPGRPACKPLRA